MRRAASAGVPCRSTPATRRATSRRSRRRAPRSSSDRVRTSCSRRATSTSPHRSCRSRSTRGKLTVAPCIGTDQMGPKRFGAKGRLAFSFGNVAQDEGSAMAAVRLEQGLADGRDRDRHRHRLLQERHRGVRGALQAARREDRRQRDVPVARQHERVERGQPPERRQGRRGRHLDRGCLRRTVDARVGAADRSATTRRSSTRGPATARTGCRRIRR